MPPRKKRKPEPVEDVHMAGKSKDELVAAGFEATLEPAPPQGQHEPMSPGKIKVDELMALCDVRARAWSASKRYMKSCSSQVKKLKLLLGKLKRIVRKAKHRPAYLAKMSEIVKYWEGEVQSFEQCLSKSDSEEGIARVVFMVAHRKAFEAHRKRLERKLRVAGVPF